MEAECVNQGAAGQYQQGLGSDGKTNGGKWGEPISSLLKNPPCGG